MKILLTVRRCPTHSTRQGRTPTLTVRKYAVRCSDAQGPCAKDSANKKRQPTAKQRASVHSCVRVAYFQVARSVAASPAASHDSQWRIDREGVILG
jgi:hypothetical protein